MDVALIELIVRFLGRVGFILLLWGAYRLWRLPVLKKHSRQIFWLTVSICTVSLAYSTIAYFIPVLSSPLFNLLFLIFNVSSTWLLALVMNYRAYAIRKYVGSKKIDEYKIEIDKIIAEIKGTPTSE